MSSDQIVRKRRQWVVNAPFQYRMIGVLLGVLVALTIGAILSVYAGVWIVLRTFELTQDPLAVSLLSTTSLLVTVELLLIAPVVVWIGVRLTHRVVGPLVRINAALLQMAEGRHDVHLTLRRGDSLTELAAAVNTLAATLRSRR